SKSILPPAVGPISPPATLAAIRSASRLTWRVAARLKRRGSSLSCLGARAMADDPMFAPLPGARRRQQAEPNADTWHPIRPVPDDVPAAPQQHYRHGKPSCRWTYLDAA